MVKDLATVTDASGGFAHNFPVLTRYLPFLTEKLTILSVRQNIDQFLDENIEMHRSTLDADNPRDFTDVYLIKMQKDKEGNVESGFTGKYTYLY
jgi:Cytochrome P450